VEKPHDQSLSQSVTQLLTHPAYEAKTQLFHLLSSTNAENGINELCTS